MTQGEMVLKAAPVLILFKTEGADFRYPEKIHKAN